MINIQVLEYTLFAGGTSAHNIDNIVKIKISSSLSSIRFNKMLHPHIHTNTQKCEK